MSPLEAVGGISIAIFFHWEKIGLVGQPAREISSRNGILTGLAQQPGMLAAKNIDGPMERWKPDIAAVKATIEFAKDTGRLQPHEQNAAYREEAEAEERSQLQAPSSTE
ncbi:hypothetical protein DM02DRAFT_635915 [Periconia macrospinosa]|uniref:Uncharacterized protein n=1 Tax=Periconia macrospinosa TaxID=97972 RepID=A0A2V1D168_9PLEO|nr:hypothetical protein DM02DRAFT_635915 [Periconia macrospinosa]